MNIEISDQSSETSSIHLKKEQTILPPGLGIDRQLCAGFDHHFYVIPYLYVDDSTSESDCFVSDNDENPKLIRYNNYKYNVLKRNSYRSWEPLNGQYSNPDVINFRLKRFQRSPSDLINKSGLNSFFISDHNISRKSKPVNAFNKVDTVNKVNKLLINSDNRKSSKSDNVNNSTSLVLDFTDDVSDSVAVQSVSLLGKKSLLVNLQTVDHSSYKQGSNEEMSPSSSIASTNNMKRKRSPTCNSDHENNDVSDLKRKKLNEKSSDLKMHTVIRNRFNKLSSKDNDTDSSSDVFINKHGRHYDKNKTVDVSNKNVLKKNVSNHKSNQRSSSISEDEGICSENRNELSNDLPGIGSQEIDFGEEPSNNCIPSRCSSRNVSISESSSNPVVDKIDKTVVSLSKHKGTNSNSGNPKSVQGRRNQRSNSNNTSSSDSDIENVFGGNFKRHNLSMVSIKERSTLAPEGETSVVKDNIVQKDSSKKRGLSVSISNNHTNESEHFSLRNLDPRSSSKSSDSSENENVTNTTESSFGKPKQKSSNETSSIDRRKGIAEKKFKNSRTRNSSRSSVESSEEEKRNSRKRNSSMLSSSSIGETSKGSSKDYIYEKHKKELEMSRARRKASSSLSGSSSDTENEKEKSVNTYQKKHNSELLGSGSKTVHTLKTSGRSRQESSASSSNSEDGRGKDKSRNKLSMKKKSLELPLENAGVHQFKNKSDSSCKKVKDIVDRGESSSASSDESLEGKSRSLNNRKRNSSESFLKNIRINSNENREKICEDNEQDSSSSNCSEAKRINEKSKVPVRNRDSISSSNDSENELNYRPETTKDQSRHSSVSSSEDEICEKDKGKTLLPKKQSLLNSTQTSEVNVTVMPTSKKSNMRNDTLLQTPTFMNALKSKPTSTPFEKNKVPRRDTMSSSSSSSDDENCSNQQVEDSESCGSDEGNTVSKKVDRYKSSIVPEAIRNIEAKLVEGVKSEQFEEDLLFVEDLSDNDEVWVAQCPKSLRVESLLGTKFNFSGKTTLSGSNTDGEHDIPYEAFSSFLSGEGDDDDDDDDGGDNGVSSNSTVNNVYCLMPSREKRNLKLKAIETKGTIKIEESLTIPTPNTIKFTSCTELTLPECLRIRHPLLGTDFSEQLKALKYLNKSCTSASSRKSKRKRRHSSPVNDDNSARGGDMITTSDRDLSYQLTEDDTPKSKKHKKKKRRRDDDLDKDDSIEKRSYLYNSEEEIEERSIGDVLTYSTKKKKSKKKHIS